MRPGLFALLFACLPLAAQNGQHPAPEAGGAVPAVGKPAPAFRLNDDAGKAVAVGGKTAGWTVLAFFPKAGTPG